VGEQVAQRNRPLRRPEPGRAGGVEALEHLRRAQAGVDVGHGALELQLALLDQLHGGDGRDRLGHRRDAKHRVERHRRALAERAHAEGTLVEQALSVAAMATTPGTSRVSTAWRSTASIRARAPAPCAKAGRATAGPTSAAAAAAAPFNTSRRFGDFAVISAPSPCGSRGHGMRPRSAISFGSTGTV
jgi:hypothetical protein